MLEIVRNMFRRKVRTGLTIFGILIGIFALTVMGSMAEYFNQLLENAMKFAGSTISVQAKGGFGISPLNTSTMRDIKRVPGVKEVIPSVIDPLQELGTVQMGTPELVLGIPPEHAQLSLAGIKLARGRWLERGDTTQVLAGWQLVKKRGLDLGGQIEWREKRFTIVGILAETNTSPDQFMVVPIETAWRTMKQPDLIMGLDVVPMNPAQIDAVAEEIKRRVTDVQVTLPREAIQNARSGLLVFNAIMLSGAILAAVVGGLSVINTMIMSVNERTREIGLKKAIGASHRDIVTEYVTEAALIGLLGGISGLALGTAVAAMLNASIAGALGGTNLFTVTPRLAVVALAFAIFLGAFAGLYPAWSAARLDPVRALRSE